MGDTEDEPPFVYVWTLKRWTQITLIVKLRFSINRKSYHRWSYISHCFSTIESDFLLLGTVLFSDLNDPEVVQLLNKGCFDSVLFFWWYGRYIKARPNTRNHLATL